MEQLFNSITGNTANNIVDSLEWKFGFYYATGVYESSESMYTYFGYIATTVAKLAVETGKIYYYVHGLPADTADRLGSVTNKLELTFCEFDSAGTWIQRNILDLPTSTIEGTTEVVRGEYTPSENAAYCDCR